MEVVSAPLFDTSHNLTGLLFIARDISGRKALQDKLRDIALTLEDALDAIPEGFAIYDRDDRLVICNDNYREIYAPSAPAMVPGNSFEEILRFGLQGKQYDTGGLTDEEWLAERLERHQSADGTVIEQNLADGRWLRISETKMRSGGTAGIRADVTELKAARARAESAYRNLSLIADNVSANITEVAPDGTCLFINKTGCEWFNGTSEDLIGTNLRDRLPWKEREAVQSIFLDALEGEKVSVEISLNFPDGVLRECHLDCTPRLNDQGGVDGLVVLITDVTDRKKTERTLAEFYAITSTRELSHEGKIGNILRLGCEHFDLPFGIISHVVNNHYTIIHAHSPNGELLPGTTCPLGDTHRVSKLEAGKPPATEDSTQSESAGHRCREVLSLKSYIGAPLLVDGIPHGTINFSAPEIRKRPFTADDLQIVRRFADWIGHEIARQRDHQALMDAKVSLERVASIDDLTQLLNRRAFLEKANIEVQRFRRSRQPLTAVMMDIDHFKLINDRCGHAVGDDVLRRFADAVSEELRTVDVFGRVGGEEFCLILSDTGLDEALRVCERLRKKIFSECRPGHMEQPITCSMGLAAASREDIEFSTLMRKADTALYEAKDAGRNRCVIHKPENKPANYF
ncbi:diguanylate cyclase [Roseibium salinum]|uniref:diguanylate cyclase n=1 Tax=Roseibium salinum TaxID=1604349 RepID=A0ABT3R801_9HYPH|nr:diguanylate cyclase [Roseibium sp. DSM 29163]MCX2725282.1 diguanylate cyclase [Roseibium sp. DSM 29163]